MEEVPDAHESDSRGIDGKPCLRAKIRLRSAVFNLEDSIASVSQARSLEKLH